MQWAETHFGNFWGRDKRTCVTVTTFYLFCELDFLFSLEWDRHFVLIEIFLKNWISPCLSESNDEIRLKEARKVSGCKEPNSLGPLLRSVTIDYFQPFWNAVSQFLSPDLPLRLCPWPCWGPSLHPDVMVQWKTASWFSPQYHRAQTTVTQRKKFIPVFSATWKMKSSARKC